jgi:hypothetical protein
MYKILFLLLLVGCNYEPSQPLYHEKVQKASQYDTIIIDSCGYTVLRVNWTLVKN